LRLMFLFATTKSLMIPIVTFAVYVQRRGVCEREQDGAYREPSMSQGAWSPSVSACPGGGFLIPFGTLP